MNIENAYNRELGVRGGKLAPLSKKPNCVSTQTENAAKRLAPVVYQRAIEKQMEKVIDAFSAMPGAMIKQQTEDYAYVVFTSKLMRFKDDVEVFLDDAQKLLHFRSASRVGYSDLGVNRKRYEEFVGLLK